jgi:hypothetical protein
MIETESTAKPHIAPTSADVLAILGQILALPEQQRTALGKAWVAMDTSSGIAFSHDSQSLGSQDSPSGFVTPAEVADLNAWIQSQEKLHPREAIAQLQSAIDQESEEWPIPLLNASIIKIKNANPWLAAELAIVKYAYEHPVLMLVALAGLGLGLYRFGKAVFSMIF